VKIGDFIMKQKSILICPVCDSPMDMFASIPAAAHLPELLRFKCQPCGCFKTIEAPAVVDRDAKAAA
jgi:hypothetical protein